MSYASVKLKDKAGKVIAWVTIYALVNPPDILIWNGRHFRPEAYDWKERMRTGRHHNSGVYREAAFVYIYEVRPIDGVARNDGSHEGNEEARLADAAAETAKKRLLAYG